MRKHSMDKRHVLPALQGFKPSWLHLKNRCGSEARFQACRDTAFETNRLPTASAHEFACYMSHRFLIFDANDWIKNCVTRELSGTAILLDVDRRKNITRSIGSKIISQNRSDITEVVNAPENEAGSNLPSAKHPLGTGQVPTIKSKPIRKPARS